MPFDAVQEAKANLRHGDIVGYVQQGKAEFRLQKRQSWQKAALSYRKKLVVDEIRRKEGLTRWAKAVSPSKQEQRANLENFEYRKLVILC